MTLPDAVRGSARTMMPSMELAHPLTMSGISNGCGVRLEDEEEVPVWQSESRKL